MSRGEPSLKSILRELVESRGSRVDNKRLVEQGRIASEVLNILSNGGGILLVAPTGFGKTEAVLAPFILSLLEESSSVSHLIHVTPLRSLIRAFFARYFEYSSKLSIANTIPGLLVSFDHGDLAFRRPKVWEDIKSEGVLYSEIASYIAKLRSLLEKSSARKSIELYKQLRRLFGHSYLFSRVNIVTFDTFVYSILSKRTYDNYMLSPVGVIANSLVVFDEVHLLQSVDHYTFEIFTKITEMLISSGVPVVAMTATLPKVYEDELRSVGFKLISAEMKQVDGIEVEVVEDKLIDSLRDRDSLVKIVESIEEVVGVDYPDILIVANTVERAVSLFERLKGFSYKGKLYNTMLVHSLFTDRDRTGRESILETLSVSKRVGERERPLLLISTQVAECGLDYPFDAVLTEVAPIDALIQRIGRIRSKGKAIVYSVGEDYPPYLDHLVGGSWDIARRNTSDLQKAPRDISAASSLLDNLYTKELVEKLKEESFFKHEFQYRRFYEFFDSLNILRNPDISVSVRPNTYIEILLLDDELVDKILDRGKKTGYIALDAERSDEERELVREIWKNIVEGSTIRVDLSRYNFGDRGKRGRFQPRGRIGSLLRLLDGRAAEIRYADSNRITISFVDILTPFELYIVRMSRYSQELGLRPL